jgi:hypothetical protein
VLVTPGRDTQMQTSTSGLARALHIVITVRLGLSARLWVDRCKLNQYLGKGFASCYQGGGRMRPCMDKVKQGSRWGQPDAGGH